MLDAKNRGEFTRIFCGPTIVAAKANIDFAFCKICAGRNRGLKIHVFVTYPLPHHRIRYKKAAIMSGAEVGFVIGLVSGTITILESIAKALDTARRGVLPKTIHGVAEVSLMLETLRAVEKRMATSGLDDEPYTALGPVMQSCRSKLYKLQAILEKSTPQPCAPAARRFVGALQIQSQAHRLEKLIRDILEDVQLIAQRQTALGPLTKVQVREEVAAAVASALPSPLPKQQTNSKGTISTIHYGQGVQNVSHGPGHQILSLGSGSVHIAETQIFRTASRH